MELSRFRPFEEKVWDFFVMMIKTRQRRKRRENTLTAGVRWILPGAGLAVLIDQTRTKTD